MKTGATKGPNVEALKRTITYFYLLSYCPAERVREWSASMAPMRRELAASASMSEPAYFKALTPEVCRRIVSFHQASREPDADWIDNLVETAREATKSPVHALAFQKQMADVAHLPQRALPDGRLHRKKGCQFCPAPCSYGYFTLVSDPQFSQLRELFAAEVRKLAGEQNPLNPCLQFARNHLQGAAGDGAPFVETRHAVNLSYCLLMLSMAKSRLPLPERQLRLFQQAAQAYIRERAS